MSKSLPLNSSATIFVADIDTSVSVDGAVALQSSLTFSGDGLIRSTHDNNILSDGLVYSPIARADGSTAPVINVLSKEDIHNSSGVTLVPAGSEGTVLAKTIPPSKVVLKVEFTVGDTTQTIWVTPTELIFKDGLSVGLLRTFFEGEQFEFLTLGHKTEPMEYRPDIPSQFNSLSLSEAFITLTGSRRLRIRYNKMKGGLEFRYETT